MTDRGPDWLEALRPHAWLASGGGVHAYGRLDRELPGEELASGNRRLAYPAHGLRTVACMYCEAVLPSCSAEAGKLAPRRRRTEWFPWELVDSSKRFRESSRGGPSLDGYYCSTSYGDN